MTSRRRVVSLLAGLFSLTFLGGADSPRVAHDRTDDALLFTYFRDNGQAGVYLAQSANGVTFTPLNDDRPIFTPPRWPGQDLTRDASILYRDGVFRMVWTSHWTGRVFGYAESRDLVTWSEPRQSQTRHGVPRPAHGRRLAWPRSALRGSTMKLRFLFPVRCPSPSFRLAPAFTFAIASPIAAALRMGAKTRRLRLVAGEQLVWP